MMQTENIDDENGLNVNAIRAINNANAFATCLKNNSINLWQS